MRHRGDQCAVLRRARASASRFLEHLFRTCFPASGKRWTKDPDDFCGVEDIIVLETVRLAGRKSHGVTGGQNFAAVPHSQEDSAGDDVGKFDVARKRVELLARPTTGFDGGVNDLKSALMGRGEESFDKTGPSKVNRNSVL